MSTQSSKGGRWKRLPRACDACKRRKVRCNSEEMPGKKCTNCDTAGLECTHVGASNALGSSKSYVIKLEKRVKDLENLCLHLLPGMDLDAKLREFESASISSEQAQPENADDRTIATLSEGIHRLAFSPQDKRFFGKPCFFAGILPTLAQKKLYIQNTPSAKAWHYSPFIPRTESLWDIKPWPNDALTISAVTSKGFQLYDFPSPSLMSDLIELYFKHHNAYVPLLHRPSFERTLAAQLHVYPGGDALNTTDSPYFTTIDTPDFAAVVMLVCALGASSSTDPRVYVDGKGFPGWKWFVQVSGYTRNLAESALPTVEEVQVHALASMFLLSCGMWRGVYLRTQMALKLVQDVGAHIRRHGDPSAHTELWKRAFWVLFYLDVQVSMAGGTSPSITFEDFDTDYPIDCDDEFWDHPDPLQNFKQPENRASKLSYFIAMVKLTVIKLTIHRALYTVRRPAENACTHLVANIHDKMLEQWYTNDVPVHLHEKSAPLNDTFIIQKTSLHFAFQHTRLFAHQLYLFGARESSKSRKVCQEAIESAHSCALQLDYTAGQWPASLVFHHFSHGTMFAIAQVFLMYATGNVTRDAMDRVQKQLSFLRRYANKVSNTGASVEIIESLFLSQADLDAARLNNPNNITRRETLEGLPYMFSDRLILESSLPVSLHASIPSWDNFGLGMMPEEFSGGGTAWEDGFSNRLGFDL
ncbi:hypothetical protein CYLTODRAFT_494407 [Cylindrobasidium torrendii FP15055 ss-10]|uniref:Zn(2)-C6 fungal-type domain-containing protein n=1 Tax=Cylindrobasidium torrendii FP15055 ss-10 TaxID=1314674 RepID=A0A0D7AWP0_9AGAR|nr:hypothetical protein CYLTODRAFT_494407 [Cylindrobasidium torrendii FP15055 ss-10]